ncbi:MAG: hypothetical protein KKA62_04575 [Nanoarchaeota archaeon]|nr:hypothetical protein [Nanoarchaeota archaeon]MBU1977196.1 hypothetical protein [Nanoarchaeota archaeon]
MTKLELHEKKSSTIEYHLLELCGNVLEGYQKRLERYEKEVDSQNIPVSWPDYQIDRDSLHNSIISLQLLLGLNCLPKMCPTPRTLEAALREVGINDEQINAEFKRCESYLQRAKELKERSLDYSEKERRATYNFLREKRRRGEPLTSEEKECLDNICEILSADH